MMALPFLPGNFRLFRTRFDLFVFFVFFYAEQQNENDTVCVTRGTKRILRWLSLLQSLICVLIELIDDGKCLKVQNRIRI